MRSSLVRQALFLLSKAQHKLQESAQYYNCSKHPDYDHYHHNVGSAEQYIELAWEQLEEIENEDHTQRLAKDPNFWKEISELGIVIYENGPSPVDKDKTQWAVDKHPTAHDEARWDRSYPTFEKAVEAVDKYWHDGEEPKMYEWMF